MRLQRVLTITVAVLTLASVAAPQGNRSPEARLRAAMDKETVDGDLKAAIDGYKQVISQRGASRAVVAEALLRLGMAYEKQGDAEAHKVYQRLTRDYADQQAVMAMTQARLAKDARSTAVDRFLWELPVGSSVGRVSPDGRFVAYTTRSDLTVRELATGTERVVAHFDEGRPGPTLAWTADGKRLAFELTNAGVEIRLINFDGSGMRTLLSGHRSWARVLDFAPDGQRVLCSRESSGDSLVFWINIADGRTQNVVVRKGPGGSGWPRLSPDGRYIALRHSPGLSVLTADGSSENIISRNDRDLNPQGWTYDGRQLLFIREQNGRRDLWSAPMADGKLAGQAVPLYRNLPSGDISNHLAKDGSLYYASFARSAEGEVYSAAIDGVSGTLVGQPLPEFSRGPGFALWSPDGRNLAFAPYGSIASPPLLLVRSIETGRSREVRPGLLAMSRIVWSPDSTRFAVSGINPAGELGLFWVDATTGNVAPIVLAPKGTLYQDQQLSSDARKLFYSQMPQGGRVTWVERDLASGEERPFIEEPLLRGKQLQLLRPSPDGRYIAFALNDPTGREDISIYVRQFGGGQTREARVPSTEVTRCSPQDWVMGSTAVIYRCDPRPGSSASSGGVWILPLDSFKPRKIDFGVHTPVDISVHPDGRRIAFTVNRPSRTELRVLENVLQRGK